VLLGAFAIPDTRYKLLKSCSDATGRVLASLPRHALAPVFEQKDLTLPEHFPVNAYLTDNPDIDVTAWRLDVKGAVDRPGRYTLGDIRALPNLTQITRHICIEGWAAVGSFGGARLADFLRIVGVRKDARFVEVECADDYYESIDMTCALHPQTILCYEMYGAPLEPAHGAPLRLQMPTKLGYKQAKHLVALRVSRELGKKRGYWVDQGYPWFGGI
jgi:DMSO/TMAO reductase YedYZ molybdopterin-dependent catalytic subunit